MSDNQGGQGGIVPGDKRTGQAWYYSKHGRFYSVAGDFAGTYVTDASTRWDDGLCGPYPTKKECHLAAEERNRDEGLD